MIAVTSGVVTIILTIEFFLNPKINEKVGGGTLFIKWNISL